MDNDSLFRARQLTDEYTALLRSVTGRRVRVLRAVVFEGDGEAVIQQLASSLPVGTREAHKGALTITVTQGEIEVLDPKPEPQPRIEVCHLDPDTLVGIAPCDDGEPGWVVMAVQPDPDAPSMEIIAPVADEHGDIVYTDILDAAEVLRTGIVWKHDMGEDEEEDPTEDELQAAQRVRDHARIGGTFGDEDEGTDDPDSEPLEGTDDPDSGPLDTTPNPAT